MISKIPKRFFSTAQISVPTLDITSFVNGQKDQKLCKEVAEAFEKYGILVVKDPRVKPQYNEEFLDMMEQYFEKRSQVYYRGEKVPDVHPEYHYQVGATPELKERAKFSLEITSKYSNGNESSTPQPPPFDQKWRYFWNMSEDQKNLVFPQVIPKDFPQFEHNMNRWGKLMLDAVYSVSQMCALGLDLQENHFRDQLVNGPHLLAPTGSDLKKYDVGTIFAGFHYDFNFLTIHGKSRYPGLFAWKRSGEKFTVKVPEGHLLLQSGKQFEKLTGGHITCGFHEVIYTEETKKVYEQRVKEGKIPWRVSSTLFSHIRGDVILEPQGKFKNAETAVKYPPISAYDHMLEELKDIELAQH